MLGLGSLFPDMLGMPSFDDVGGMLASPEQIALWEMMKQRPEIQDIFSRGWSADVESNAGENELMGGAYSDVLGRFATLESGGGRFRSNPMSSARGLLHFMPDTWKGVLRNYPDLGFTPEDIDDDAKQKRAAEVLMEREIVPALRRTLGREPTGAELYTAWALGTPDAQKLFGADPNTPAASLFRPKVASSNPSIFYRDKEATMPRTVAEVAAEYARRWSGAKPTKEPTMQQPEYDVDEGLANVARMGQRVAQMQPAGVSALPDRQPGQGLSALSPYLQIASQLMPQREGRPWADALINAGAAMMQSRSPDFLGGLGAGLQAGNQTLTQGQNLARQDTLDRFKLGMQLAQYDQKDTKPIALAEGGMLVTPDGRTVASNPKARDPKAPLVKEFKEGDRIVTKQWNGAMWVPVSEAPAHAPPAGFTRGPGGGLVVDHAYLDAQRQIREAGRPTTNIDLKGETKEKEAVGKALGEMYAEKVSLGAKGQQMYDTVSRAEQLLNGLNTGALAPAAITAQKYLTALGIPLEVFGNAGQLGQAEAAGAVANQMALQLRNTGEGGGMPGALSDKDREFLVSMTPGLGQTETGRKMIIDSFKRLAQRQIEESRLAEQWYEEKGTMKGFNSFMRDHAQKNPLFAGMQIPTAPQSGGPAAPPPGPRELPPSDADVRKAQPGAPQSGGILPKPKRFDLGTAPKVGAQPPAGNIPKFTDPNDPGLAKLPSGSVFYDGNGTLRVKP